MPKNNEKVKVNVKERVEDDICDLSLSELREIPVREIASFNRVTTLDLSSNKLVNLGKHFTTLTRLMKLDLSKNQIKFLPDDFGLLENLRHLDLYDNRLEHIPLSFDKLRKLRYLDLKGNPLAPAWAKVVGHCLTTKDCQEAAKKTVQLCANYKIETIEKPSIETLQKVAQTTMDQPIASSNNNSSNNNSNYKKQNKKSKVKHKKSNATHANSNNSNNNEITIKEVIATNSQKAVHSKNKRKSQANNNNKSGNLCDTALSSILIFLILLAINVVIIYMIMFKNPEIADKIVEAIPHQYRDWILTKTEIFRLCLSDWISQFRTPPEEH